MRRHTRTVRRKRFLEVLGERDAVGSAVPGLACGVLAVVLAVFASALGRARPAQAATDPAAARSGVASPSSASSTAPVSSASSAAAPLAPSTSASASASAGGRP